MISNHWDFGGKARLDWLLKTSVSFLCAPDSAEYMLPISLHVYVHIDTRKCMCVYKTQASQ